MLALDYLQFSARIPLLYRIGLRWSDRSYETDVPVDKLISVSIQNRKALQVFNFDYISQDTYGIAKSPIHMLMTAELVKSNDNRFRIRTRYTLSVVLFPFLYLVFLPSFPLVLGVGLLVIVFQPFDIWRRFFNLKDEYHRFGEQFGDKTSMTSIY